MTILDLKTIQTVSGLNPSAVLCVGGGYVREEVKAVFFNHQLPLISTAIQNPISIASYWVPDTQDRILEAAARVEVLKDLFRNESIRAALPGLSERRLRPHFFEKLDRTLQRGRMFFSHPNEAQAMENRLNEALGRQDLRSEYFVLNDFWERVLNAKNWLDEAMVFELATERIAVDPIPKFWLNANQVPKKIIVLEHFALSPRLKNFWSELNRKIPVEFLVVKPNESTVLSQLSVKESHSIEDAILFCFDEILSDLAIHPAHHHAFVIQDRPQVRRIITRTARKFNLNLFDPRDPTDVRMDEALKQDRLEFEMASKDFPRVLISQWVHHHPRWKSLAGSLRKDLNDFAFVRGLQNLPATWQSVLTDLKKIQERFSKRISVAQLATAFLNEDHSSSLITQRSFWESWFEDWVHDLRRVNAADRKQPIRLIYDLFEERIKSARPSGLTYKFRNGISIYRVDQAVSLQIQPTNKTHPTGQTHLHFFGLDASYFEMEDRAQDWFSSREVDLLSLDFALTSSADQLKQKENSFLAWVSAAGFDGGSQLWTQQYLENGSESEGVLAVLAQMRSLNLKEPIHLGAHPNALGAKAKPLCTRTSEVHQSSALKSDGKYSMSFLDDYSECPFTALASQLWKAYDEQEPDYELRPDVYGQLMHLALEKMVRFQLAADVAFQQAWSEGMQKSWIPGQRLKSSIEFRMVKLLQEFWEQEIEYRQKSGAETMAMENDLMLTLERDGCSFSGRADRIDQHHDGLIVIDYKTQASSKLAKSSASQVLKSGHGLQLALYGLAAKERFNQEVIAAQFISLNSKVNRNLGLLFAQWNGSKVKNPISNARSNNGSLVQDSPEVIWKLLDQKVQQAVHQLKQGVFSAVPTDPEDCKRCRYRVACGQTRRSRGILTEEGAEI